MARTCSDCGANFKTCSMVDGILRNLGNRTRCLTCLPFKDPRGRLRSNRVQRSPCEICGQPCKKNARRACSRSCYGQLQRKPRALLMCGTCNKPFERLLGAKHSSSGFVFCSRSCKDRAQRTGGVKSVQLRPNDHPQRYRQHALARFGARCKNCGFDADPAMLDVDHIDSDRSNRRLDNLQVLCVWCHALKTRRRPYISPRQVAEVVQASA